MQHHHPGEAPDYTNAFLAMMGLIVFMSLFVVAALFGFLWVIFSAVGFDRGAHFAARRVARHKI
ncbi:hypothetical protein AADZ90_016335 [Aestuariibius sp. 2305UL40-4]|uniref:hypothetical protein n=1 Tax=Aestuariibius violaceus TaxID=3234132 RepID=UPI00345EC56D